MCVRYIQMYRESDNIQISTRRTRRHKLTLGRETRAEILFKSLPRVCRLRPQTLQVGQRTFPCSRSKCRSLTIRSLLYAGGPKRRLSPEQENPPAETPAAPSTHPVILTQRTRVHHSRRSNCPSLTLRRVKANPPW